MASSGRHQHRDGKQLALCRLADGKSGKQLEEKEDVSKSSAAWSQELEKVNDGLRLLRQESLLAAKEFLKHAAYVDMFVLSCLYWIRSSASVGCSISGVVQNFVTRDMRPF